MAEIHRVPPWIGWYVAGFVDGEGSFNVVFRPRTDHATPWRVSLCFNVSQRDKVILALLKRHLGCGTLRGRDDGVWYFEVNNLNAIRENVIPFFKRFGFLSAKKKRDFSLFCRIAELVAAGRQRDLEGLTEILRLRRDMNDGGKRRYSEEQILERFEGSSEAIRWAPDSQVG